MPHIYKGMFSAILWAEMGGSDFLECGLIGPDFNFKYSFISLLSYMGTIINVIIKSLFNLSDSV